ncbi:hypothetical protein ABZ357_27785 [Streptomyces sp. NPDC005917]|uniref:hypothetical protein n=1 Tax=unclassified Streptomyces TaxID=2593676 RepID=UPI0033E642F0
MHEREWRLPVKEDSSIGSLSAILVGDVNRPPSLIRGWVDRSTGKVLIGEEKHAPGTLL